MTEGVGPAAGPSRSEWSGRREARARQARIGGAVAVGTVLALVGVVLGLAMALEGSALAGSAIAVISLMLGLLIFLVGSLLDERPGRG
jgi:protein-S-isoprenylcysteine O-methyltransferase Ste14